MGGTDLTTSRRLDDVCPPKVEILALSTCFPLWLRKRTFGSTVEMSGLCRFCCRSLRLDARGGGLNFLKPSPTSPLSYSAGLMLFR